MLTTSTRIKQFLEDLKTDIRPGTRGAPVRRKLYHRALNAHARHMRQMDCSGFRHTDRMRTRFSPEHGFNVSVGMVRHNPSDPKREAAGRLMKIHNRLFPIIRTAPAEDLIRWINTLHIDLNRLAREGGPGLKQYLDRYPTAKTDHRLYRGKIYEYAEDTEWEKYGKRSYPRTVDRRIEVYGRQGRIYQKTYFLDTGERAETALNRMVPNRAKKIAAARARERREYIRELNRPKEAWKIVEQNGKLRSVYDPNTIYRLRHWLTEKPKEDHEGGLYCFGSKADAIDAAKANDVFNDSWKAGKTLVLCRCERKGETIEYGAKIAAEHLRIMEVVEEISA